MDQQPPVVNPADILQTAVRAFASRDWAQSEALCRQVLLSSPGHADALHILGLVCSNTGRPAEAVAHLRAAIALQSTDPILWMDLAIIYLESQQFVESVECELSAIRLKPDFAEAYYNLSLAYWRLGRFEDAMAAAMRATELRPRDADFQFHAGNLLRQSARPIEAIAAYQIALQLRPDWADPHLNIAAAWNELGQPATALEHYRLVLKLKPDCSAAEYSMAAALLALGRVEEAKAAYERAAVRSNGTSRYADAMSVLARESLAEVIAPDGAAIEVYKARVDVALQAFAAAPGEFSLSITRTHLAVPSVMLAYYGGNVRPIMEQYAQAIGPHMPKADLRPRTGKPKLGIIVTHGHERVFSRCWGGIAQRLSRELFDVKLVASRGGASVLQATLQVPPDELVRLPNSVESAAEVLLEQEFDWLHFWEIASDVMNYYLPFFRTAPGQSGSWGWPVTSGNPCVDAYVTSDQLELSEGATHYTEQLIRLRSLPTYFVRPSAPSGSVSRDRFGVDDREHLYLCTQNLRKYHPDFDLLLSGLLRSDPGGVLLIMGDYQAPVTNLLLNRFRRTLGNVANRVRAIPWLNTNDYLSLVSAADVVLDTVHYGGGAQTVYDAVAVGTPMVTLPNEFHRSRWAAAVNRRLGLPQLIAATLEEYVAKAVEVASNPDLRRALRKQILEAGAELFEDMAVVREHEEYFSQAIAATRAKNRG